VAGVFPQWSAASPQPFPEVSFSHPELTARILCDSKIRATTGLIADVEGVRMGKKLPLPSAMADTANVSSSTTPTHITQSDGMVNVEDEI